MFYNDVKNKINQILGQEINITNEMPSKDNFAIKNPRRAWISTIFIDMVGYTELCKNKSDEYVAKLMRVFHEGILSIFYEYDIKNIQIQGDGIYGILHTPKRNGNNNEKILDAAMHIQGYLNCFLRPKFNYDFNYKIGIALNEELMLIVGRKDEREIVYAGGSVNKAKKLLEKYNDKNVIYIDQLFYSDNKDLMKCGSRAIVEKANHYSNDYKTTCRFTVWDNE